MGHAVIRLGKLLRYQVTVIDDRPEFTAKAVKAGADHVITEEYARGLKGIAGDQDTCFVIVTRGHYDDLESLVEILNKDYAYVGLMGSSRKTVVLTKHLREQGFSEETISQVHMPIGLPIGAETPEEIAVCIMGEIIQVCNTKERKFGFPEEILDAICEKNEPMVLATVIRKVGSGPRDAGTKMLVLRDGKILGTAGGGIVEAETIKTARRMLDEPDGPEILTISVEMKGEQIDSKEMICGGRMDVMLERIYN